MTELDHAVLSVYENAVDTLIEHGYQGVAFECLASAGAYSAAYVLAPDYGIDEDVLRDAVAAKFGTPNKQDLLEWHTITT